MNALKFLIALALGAGIAVAPVAAQGRLGLLPQGRYACALPGDATGAAWIEIEGRSFSITGGSSYESERGSGTYLLEGKQVIFTRGPEKGMKLMLLGSGLLQEVDKDGRLGRMRCHRVGPLGD